MTETNATPTAIDWPKSEPSADEMLHHLVSSGLWASAAIWAHLEATRGLHDDPANIARHFELIARMQQSYDLHRVLAALKEADPEKADEEAKRIWLAAEAGDSYGEELFAWAYNYGLDTAAIYEAGHAAGADVPTRQ